MTIQQLEGRLNAKKDEFLPMLKVEGFYIDFCETKGYIYEIFKPLFNVLHRIRLSIKNGRIVVHTLVKL
ncbi:hypothetical protein ACQKNX_23045 [Lysinibacillus sp. NPDC093712]|uniref:hypothetical protein n=1 Tax=Lysinibacillus sp. NPDC093712 TaxID=3390579 RepID=UPI003CFF0884